MSSESESKKSLFSWFRRGKKNETPVTEADIATQPSQSQVSEPLPAAPVQPIADTPLAPNLTADSQVQLTEQATAVATTAAPATIAVAPVIPEVAVITAAVSSETPLAAVATASETPAKVATVPAEAAAASEIPAIDAGRDKPRSWFARLKDGLKRTRSQLGDGLASLFLGRKAIDQDLFDELETQLVMADVGIDTTVRLLDELTQEVSRKQLKDSDALLAALKLRLKALLAPVTQPLQIDSSKQPYMILVVGVNGAGKTTTIGKLAKHLQQQGKSVMLAAGDTFRAAAVEQLQVWGERNAIPVIAQHTGADSASVVFDALQAAKARGVDVLIADTAGRLHNKAHLMEELKKVTRVINKLEASAPHEVMLVLDATIGQNAISQAEHFVNAVGVNSLALTKLDGTAKGGIIFAIADRFNLPIRFIGVGEAVTDLREFNGDDFVDALFDQNQD